MIRRQRKSERLRSDEDPRSLGSTSPSTKSNESLDRRDLGLEYSYKFFKGLLIGIVISLVLWAMAGLVLWAIIH